QQREIIVRRARREQGPKLAELAFSRVVAGEPGGAFELDDKGIERAVLVVRRAEIAQARVGLGFDMVGKRTREPRFADTRLAGNQHHPSFPRPRLFPAAQEQLDFLVTSDQRRFPRAQRRKPVYLIAFTQHAPSALRLGKTGKLLWSEILQIEQL